MSICLLMKTAKSKPHSTLSTMTFCEMAFGNNSVNKQNRKMIIHESCIQRENRIVQMTTWGEENLGNALLHYVQNHKYLYIHANRFIVYSMISSNFKPILLYLL